MPAKQKRALQEADPNAETRADSTGQTSKKQKQKENQPPAAATNSDKNAASKEKDNANGHNHDETPMDELPPFEYILIDRPMYDFKSEARARAEEHEAGDDSEEEDDEDDEDEKLVKKWEEAKKASKHGELASTKPEHKWILMRGTWIQIADAVRLASYRNPDSFGMYIYNDFEGYGIHEMVENFLVRYNKEFTKKETDQSLEEMWSTISALVHWMNYDRSVDIFGHIDDGERVEECWGVIGKAFLSMLNSLERAKQLGADSKFKDLKLVTALIFNLRAFWVDIDVDFQLDLLRFLQDHKIDISDSGVSGLDKYIAEQQEQLADHPDPPKAGLDRYGFKAAWKSHASSYGKGGDHYDITKMSRAERKKHAFDGKDPLAGFSDKEIKSGGLMLA